MTMRTCCAANLRVAILVLHLAVLGIVGEAADVGEPVFTGTPVMLCTGTPYVATVWEHSSRLVIILVGTEGIAMPREILLDFDGVYGIKCGFRRIELLVRTEGSDHFSRLPFTIKGEDIHQETARDIDYSISSKGPTPPELDEFHEGGLDRITAGSWYSDLGVLDINHRWALHFVRTQTRLNNPSGPRGVRTDFTLDVIEKEPFIDGKVVRSFPLIKSSNFEAAD